jgi:hypothetical protein
MIKSRSAVSGLLNEDRQTDGGTTVDALKPKETEGIREIGIKE